MLTDFFLLYNTRWLYRCFCQVLDEIASAQVQMCASLEASLVVSLESFADTEMLEVTQLKEAAESETTSAEAAFSRYLNGRNADKLGDTPVDAWNKVSESATSQIPSSVYKMEVPEVKKPKPMKARRSSSNSSDPQQVQASTAANLQLTLEQIRLAQASAELKRFQLLKKLVSIKVRTELYECLVSWLHFTVLTKNQLHSPSLRNAETLNWAKVPWRHFMEFVPISTIVPISYKAWHRD